jgi:hypothetical protein
MVRVVLHCDDELERVRASGLASGTGAACGDGDGITITKEGGPSNAFEMASGSMARECAAPS